MPSGRAANKAPAGPPFPTAALDSTLGALPVPAYANDLEGYVVWQNEASRAMAGDMRGIHYTAVVPPDELPRARETWAAVTLSGDTRRRTGEFLVQGKRVRLEVIAAPVRQNNRVVGVFGLTMPCNDAAPRQPGLELSRRQLDILQLLVQAKSTKQIAEELHLAPETVRNYIAGLLKELGARNRLEAALIALRTGLVSLDLH